MENKILDSVNTYYTQKIKEHGVTPRGVDWNSIESQELRFEQLCSVIKDKAGFSVLDFGCGYGALLDYLTGIKGNFHYTGLDISEEMIAQAVKKHTNDKNATWKTKPGNDELYDYTVASGIFSVRLNTGDDEWKKYITDTLDTINKHSKKGFAFNMLTIYSDKEFMRDDLYYADPAFFFDYCKKNFSKYVALLHDYPIYEFTILIKKN